MKLHHLFMLALAAVTPARASLVAHYDFDTVGSNAGVSFTNEVTSGGVKFANAGSRAAFDQTCRRLGTGSLVLKNRGGSDTAGADGAVSNNTFDWGATGYNSDVRTVAFWVKAAVTQGDANPTMISMGAGSTNGNRFDIRLSGGALRLEIQGAGFTATNALNDDTWHHVAIVVPNAASTLANVKYYIDGNLIGNMTGTASINTSTGPLRMGDSYMDTGRDFDGSLDDVRLYNEALNDTAVAALYNNGVANRPGILCFNSTSTSIIIGQSLSLTWEVDPAASSAEIDNGIGDILTGDPDGKATMTVSPTADTTYTLTVHRGAETIQQQVAVTVRTSPDILYFHAVPTTIRNGGSVSVYWNTAYADSVTVDDGTGPVTVGGSGFYEFAVTADTTFTLTAGLTGGTPAVATASVDVRSGADPVSYEETILADNPLAYYRFEEPIGCPTIFDHSPNFKDSTSITGNVQLRKPGAIGSAVRFNNAETIALGLNFNPQDPDGDDTTGDVDPDGVEAWSVELLVKPDSATRVSGSQNLLSNQDGTGTGRTDLMITYDKGALASFFGATSQYSDTPLFSAAWSHLVMVAQYQSATANYTVRYYVNGQPAGIVTGVPIESATGAWVLGSHKIRQTGVFYAGLMDEVSFYKYALDDPDANGDMADSKVPGHFAAYIQDGAPLLSFGTHHPVVHRSSGGTLSILVGDAAQSVTIDNGVGTVTPVNGVATVNVFPSVDTLYTITVNDGVTNYTATANVTVIGELVLLANGFTAPGVFQITAGNLIPGNSYHLYFATDLQTLVSAPTTLNSFIADAYTKVLSDAAAPAGKGFYRLGEDQPDP